ncbi:MAG: cytochrome oxidase subunit III [Saprospirales bacterium]|nr:MAG: cytochrome oxidase subunit III [Saprospirales bacterium]
MSEEITVKDPETAKTGKASWEGGSEPFKASYGKLMMWYFIMSDAFTFAGFLIAYGALRFSVPTWPEPDFVFQSFPGGFTGMPLIFVTLMTFVLIASSATMVRAVQEGQRENKKGVVFWLLMTIVGGSIFLGCQAWEWHTLIVKEHMTISENPFSRHVEAGTYLAGDGYSIQAGDTFEPGDEYLIHKVDGEWNQIPYRTAAGEIKLQEFGPPAFGALFYFITGFHGFHVLSGLIILLIITINVASGLYVKRRNGYEMVEKVGLYWHFVDLVWVFVFLVFYLL